MGRRIYSHWLPVLLWAAVIFAFSSLPQGITPSLEGEALDFLAKKAAHVFEYAVLSLLLYRALRAHGRSGWWCVLGVGLYALSDELHQSFVPGRGAAFRDVFIDLATAGAMVLLLNYHRGRPRAQAKG